MLEFMPHPEPELLAEALVGFANADGGTIVVGVTSSGTLADELEEEHIEALLLRAEHLCHPPVQTTWQTLETKGGAAVAISVARSPDLHSLSNGSVLLRSGDKNRPLTGQEISQLASAKGTGEYEREPVESATRADLNDKTIAEYAAKRRLRGPRGEQPAGEDLLIDSGAIDARGCPTVSGVLLFGHNPQRLFPQSSAVFVRFAGTRATTGQGLPGYARREEITGPLGRVIEQLWNVIWEEMRHESVISGLEREERSEYPPFAVREAIVNAVAHRDYRVFGRHIEVRMFDDRLEIISPGGLPGHITLDNIVDEHYSRNPLIVKGLYYWGFIEELGLGIDRMIEEMREAGHADPQFNATPFTFKVTLRNALERVASRWAHDLNERQIQALTFLEQNNRITNRDYQSLCPDVTPETLRLDLGDMVDKGILLRIGSKKGTYYILK